MAKVGKPISIICCFVILVCSELTSALGILRTDVRNVRSQLTDPRTNANNDFLEDQPPVPPMFKRACNGFPCMYSHLGTKAGRASLYKTLAGFIDECFSNPDCDPGRRKRFNSMESIHRLLNTPIRDNPGDTRMS